MARLAERLPDNAPGDFYVDRTCIDCDTCRRIAPAVFEEGEGHSFVHAQPTSDFDKRRALMAFVACPTSSIGTVTRTNATPGAQAFPEPVDENVAFCGFTSEQSFAAGATSSRAPAATCSSIPPAQPVRCSWRSRPAAASRRCS